MIVRGEKYPELWENNKLIGCFVGENPVTFEAKEPITFDAALDMADFLSGGEFRWLFDQIYDFTASFGWWGVSNDEFGCLLYTSPSPRDRQKSRMPSSA